MHFTDSESMIKYTRKPS